jgi:hypothetical protein
MLTQAIVASITVVAIVGKWTGKDFWGEGRTVRARIYHSPDQASTPAREPAASPSSIWSWTVYGSMIRVYLMIRHYSLPPRFVWLSLKTLSSSHSDGGAWLHRTYLPYCLPLESDDVWGFLISCDYLSFVSCDEMRWFGASHLFHMSVAAGGLIKVWLRSYGRLICVAEGCTWFRRVQFLCD